MMNDQSSNEQAPPDEQTTLTPAVQQPNLAETVPPNPTGPSQSGSSSHPGRKYLAIILALMIIAIVGVSAWLLLSTNPKTTTSTSPPVRIGLSMGTLTTARWPVEEALMEKLAASEGATVVAYNANGDTATQISQIQNLIVQKVNVIIIVANDSSLLAPVTQTAKSDGIKVIAYDRLIDGSGTTEYISFSSYQVGVDWANYMVSVLPPSLKTANVAFIEGASTDNNVPQLKSGVMSVFNPLIKSGKIDLVFDQNIAGWDPGVAYTTFKTFMAGGTRVDAVIGGNDELANSAIEVLQPLGLAGKIPIVGQDGELGAIQRIETGTQMMTVYKPGVDEADMAIKDAIALTKGQTVKSNTTISNGTVNVASYLFTPIPVTKANVNSVIIKAGVYTSNQIFGTPSTAK
jgi:D-xylose transport system substrate-binding protein